MVERGQERELLARASDPHGASIIASGAHRGPAAALQTALGTHHALLSGTASGTPD